MIRLYTLVFTLLISVSLIAQTGFLWNYDVNDMAFGNAASADLDGDGYLEIVFSTYRNDSSVYVLNAEDGSLLWKVNLDGCNDAAPLIFDVDNDNELEVVIASSCVAKTTCFEGATGILKWETATRGSDSPPSVADLDGDGDMEILHGEFGGYVICLNGDDGTVKWEIEVDQNSWVQTAPAILDVDNDGNLDFVVGTWVFGGEGDVYAFTGDSANMIWHNPLPQDFIYHGASFADIDGDLYKEVVIGAYDGYVYAINAEDGSNYWNYKHPNAYPQYVGAPTSIADLDNDTRYDVVFISGNTVAALTHDGILMWDYTISGYRTSFRGAGISDMNGDDTLDVVFGTGNGELIALSGSTGAIIFHVDLEANYGSSFDIDHGPVIDDFDKDGFLDVFVVGGHAEYPDIVNNYGRAYAISTESGVGSNWPMFRYDERRSGCRPDTVLVNAPLPIKEKEALRCRVHQNSLYLGFARSDDYNIQLIDMSGRMVLVHECQGRGTQINIDQLPHGMYAVIASALDKNLSAKFIK
jgi:outer membrane protein assembly factor BamB